MAQHSCGAQARFHPYSHTTCQLKYRCNIMKVSRRQLWLVHVKHLWKTSQHKKMRIISKVLTQISNAQAAADGGELFTLQSRRRLMWWSEEATTVPSNSLKSRLQFTQASRVQLMELCGDSEPAAGVRNAARLIIERSGGREGGVAPWSKSGIS